MKEVQVSLQDESYTIYIGDGILTQLGSTLARYDIGKRVAIVTNPTVNKLYGSPVTRGLEKTGFEAFTVEVPDGEAYKSMETAMTVYERLIDHRMERRSATIALGGGVVGDLAGFVAATYLRGVPFVQVPTSLLAQVDSSVGGKVAVNHPKGKNLIGAFYQPKLVWIDISTLRTLSLREVRSGLAEVVKYGVIEDDDFFSFLEESTPLMQRLDSTTYETIVTKSCEMKRDVVEKDPEEKGLRMILNYGHTIGHALEALTHYDEYTHGEAVAVGMSSAARISVEMGILQEVDAARQDRLLHNLDLSTRIPKKVSPEMIMEAMTKDKKVKDDKIRFVLPTRIGQVTITDSVPRQVVQKVLEMQA